MCFGAAGSFGVLKIPRAPYERPCPLEARGTRVRLGEPRPGRAFCLFPSSLFKVQRFKIQEANQIIRSMTCGFFCEVFGDSCEESGGFWGVKVRDSGSKMRLPGRYYEVFGETPVHVREGCGFNYEVFGETAYGAQQAAGLRLARRFLVLPAR